MKQKNNMTVAGQLKSRRALGDIGNVVTLQENGKLLPAITRPVTRSFSAQLLANAQKDLAENKKKTIGINVEYNNMVSKKKATMKPKPPPVSQNMTVIEISPDTEEISNPSHLLHETKKHNHHLPQLSLQEVRLPVALTTNRNIKTS